MAPKAAAPAPGSSPLALPSFKYGMPLYGAAWSEGNIFYVCGGGGSSSSGIKNRLVFAECNDGLLTDQLGDFNFGLDCPMRMAMAPSGKSIVFAMGSGGIKRLDVDTRGKVPRVTEVSGDLASRLAELKGEVKCLSFSPSGDHLALGHADGALQVVEWPGLRVKLDCSGSLKLKDGVRDVDMAPGARSHAVAVVLDNGSAEIWDWETGEVVVRAGLARGEFKSDAVVMVTGPHSSAAQPLPRAMWGAQFTRLRYAPAAAAAPTGAPSTSQPATSNTLYALMNSRAGCFVAVWQQAGAGAGALTLAQHCKVSDAPGACLDVARNGRLLAVGTSEGAAMILDASSLSVLRVLPKAHMVFSTGIYLAADARGALSISADASATFVPATAPPRPKGNVQRVVILLITIIGLSLAIFLQVMREMKASGNYELLLWVRRLLGKSDYDFSAPKGWTPYDDEAAAAGGPAGRAARAAAGGAMGEL